MNVPEFLKKKNVEECVEVIHSEDIHERKFILRFENSNYYIGEERCIQYFDEENEYVSVGAFCVVDDIQKAVPIPRSRLNEFNTSCFVSPEYQKHYGVLQAISYCGGY